MSFSVNEVSSRGWKIRDGIRIVPRGELAWSGEGLSQGILKGEVSLYMLTSCLTGLNESVLKIKTKIFSRHTDDSKPVKQEVNGTVILLPLVFPG